MAGGEEGTGAAHGTLWGEISKLRDKQHKLANDQAAMGGQMEITKIVLTEIRSAERIAVLEANHSNLEKTIVAENSRTRWMVGLLVPTIVAIICLLVNIAFQYMARR